MVRTFKLLALAGVVTMAAAPAFAQANPMGIDLDPFHIFTPAPAPVAAAPMMMKHHHHRGAKHRKNINQK